MTESQGPGGQHRATEGVCLVPNPQACVNGLFVEQLDLAVSSTNLIEAGVPDLQSGVRGVFAAGDVASPYKAVNVAIASGFAAVVAIIAQLHAAKYKIPERYFDSPGCATADVCWERDLSVVISNQLSSGSMGNSDSTAAALWEFRKLFVFE